jgi:hypothetical protein
VGNLGKEGKTGKEKREEKRFPHTKRNGKGRERRDFGNQKSGHSSQHLICGAVS